ncbi:MAG: alginate lyase family protein [Deltaproteobacteria bacterium]|nr:alginate lyase family protein [Deltaproteobacteria bacterium]
MGLGPAKLTLAGNFEHVVNPRASFIDVAARREELKAAAQPRLLTTLAEKRSCQGAHKPRPPAGRILIPGHYLHGVSGPVNPEEGRLSRPYFDLQKALANGAGRYLATGDSSEASCMLDILYDWARAGTLLDYDARESKQAWFEVSWTIGSVALSFSVVAADPTLDPAQRKAVLAWLKRAATHMIHQSSGPNNLEARNNLSYWRGLAATAVGVIAGDDVLFRWGLDQYIRAIGQMNPDGAWPEEMARHELCLKYQSFAIEPLVMIAELAACQGIDLYRLKQNGRQLSDAVRFLAAGLANPSIIRRYTPEPQALEEFRPGSGLVCWLEFWNRRFGPPGLESLITKPFFKPRGAGSATLYAAPK